MSYAYLERFETSGARPRRMALTLDHVARCWRAEPVPTPNPKPPTVTDADREALAQRLMGGRDRSRMWIFAYGSLIWRPEFDVAEARRATALGWHREFCLSSGRFRGTEQHPGLMLALQPGGRCAGVALRPAADEAEAVVRKVVFRETGPNSDLDPMRVIRLRIGDDIADAIVFWAGPKGPNVPRRLPLPVVARRLAHACGHNGSCAEYLYNTVSHLEQLGIRDRNLWEIQRLAAEEIISWDSKA